MIMFITLYCVLYVRSGNIPPFLNLMSVLSELFHVLSYNSLPVLALCHSRRNHVTTIELNNFDIV